MKSLAWHGKGPQPLTQAINLPSGLPAVSTAAAGRRMLAIDKAGALFLSEDAGNAWQRVLQQWTGHAVAVRRHSVTPAPPATAAGQPRANGSGSRCRRCPSARLLSRIL